MGLKYIRLSIAIHGLDADDDMPPFLVGWLRAATKAALMGHQRELFRFRDEFDSDIEVTVCDATDIDMPRNAAD